MKAQAKSLSAQPPGPVPRPAAPAWQARSRHSLPGDPYLDWALATQWQGFPTLSGPASQAYPADAWVPLIAPRGPALQALLRRDKALLRINPMCPPDVAWLTLWVHRSAVERLRQSVPGCELSQVLPVRFEAARPLSPKRGRPSIPLVLGSIDRGGAFLNQVFQAPGRQGTCRLLSYWDQESLPPLEPGSAWQLAPAGYGRELSASALQALHQRSQHRPDAEAAIYQELGLPELLRAAACNQPDHATHVLDTLAGLPASRRNPANAKPEQLDAAAHAPLVMVSVPGSLEGQTTGAACVAQILDGLHHILHQAQAHAPEAAVVVNISLGALGGPHDGSSALEQAIDDLMRKRPRLLVVFAAGNSGGDLLLDPTCGTNAAGSLAAGQSAQLTWRLQPGDPTDSFLELWWKASTRPVGTRAQPSKTAQALQLRVVAPFRSAWLQPGQQLDLTLGRRLLGRLHLQALDAERGRAQLSLAPVRGERGGLPAGRWLLELRNAGQHALQIEARIQGDLPRWTDPAPVQSVLVEAQGLQLGGAGSLNGLATGQLPLLVGAAHADDERDSLYSARLSPTDRRHRLVRAVADEGPLAYGLIAAGVLSGSQARMGGTSVAAPVAARHWANRLARGGQAPRPEDWLEFLSKQPQARKPPTAQRIKANFTKANFTKASFPVLRPQAPATAKRALAGKSQQSAPSRVRTHR